MQNFSVSSSSVEEVVQPNIAVQRVALQKTSATVLFSALKGSTNGLVSDRILIDEHATNLKTDDRTEIQMLINVANSTGRERVGFVLYQNDRLFPSKNYRNRLEENNSNQIISGNAHGTMINHVKIALSPQYNSSKFLLHNYACVFWDYSQNDWNTSGCTKEKDLSELLKCSCNHTTNFAVLMSFKINYKYLKPLKIVSYIGCGLSIGGLTSTIVFQIHTRKTRKMSTTIILVSLCSSMLIFNIIFISGIENSNANKSNSAISAPNTMLESDEEHPLANSWCTAVAALLHYFLLATFMWTTLNSVQLYLLTIKTQRHFHRNYSLIMLLTGWGTPALLVSITLAVTVENSNYRQEEFCWLEALEPDGTFSAEKPMLWAFLLPVAVILLFNFTVFMKITIFVIWKENKHLTSTKRKSYMMKIFGTLSIAVVLGITWILGYLMLIDHEQTNTAFSYLFCIFNATQGLQIFVFHVLATPTGKKKIGEVFASLSEMRLYLHSKTYYLLDMLHIKSPNESFRFSGSRRNVDNLSMSSSNEEMWQR
ncbi:adhesion G-protein coupled receptor G7 [Rhineura floridana]|uniref:adhesion G-protein coupled receptor G7 n=1 Tax=Rhineura floridana TaxID=261503 RepID=UPI002AC7F0E7|nr:adhesion G-protein coupled receptor G7 [Rhineura floridana]